MDKESFYDKNERKNIKTRTCNLSETKQTCHQMFIETIQVPQKPCFKLGIMFFHFFVGDELNEPEIWFDIMNSKELLGILGPNTE